MSEAEIQELVLVFPSVQQVTEAGVVYFLLPGLLLPETCVPNKVDALLCPSSRDGYASRLFFSAQISGCPQRNWNAHVRILDRTWYGISWKVPDTQRLVQMVLTHLTALKS
jgi:hypothetical protein